MGGGEGVFRVAPVSFKTSTRFGYIWMLDRRLVLTLVLDSRYHFVNSTFQYLFFSVVRVILPSPAPVKGIDKDLSCLTFVSLCLVYGSHFCRVEFNSIQFDSNTAKCASGPSARAPKKKLVRQLCAKSHIDIKEFYPVLSIDYGDYRLVAAGPRGDFYWYVTGGRTQYIFETSGPLGNV